MFQNKFYVALLFLWFSSYSQFAQENFSPVTGIGIRQGINLNGMRFVPTQSHSRAFGYCGGIYINYLGEKHAGIQVEVNYTQKGWKEESDTIPLYQRTMSYVEIPFLSHFSFGRRLRFDFNLGPYISYQTAFFEDIDKPNDVEGEFYFGKKCDRLFDFGFQGGLLLGVNTKIGVFMAEFRYVQGINNLYERGEFEYFQTNSIYGGICYQIEIVSKKQPK